MSSFSEWDPALETGDETVDAQHRQLYELVWEMYNTIMSGRSDQLVAESFDRILAYTHTHFAYEEALMERWHYPDLAIQQAQHREFAEEIDQLWNEILCGQNVSSIGLVQFMETWLNHHVDQEDRKISVFIRSRKD
jgi:hemerythrin